MSMSAFRPPPLPRWLLFLRLAILAISVGVLAAAAYNVSLSSYILSSSPAGFLIFDAVFTLLLVGAMLACELGPEWLRDRFYSRLLFTLFLGLDGAFWLAGWAWAATWAGRLLGFNSEGTGELYRKFAASITASAVLGAITWIMVIVLTFAFARACLRDNSDYIDHESPEYGSPEYYAYAAELGERKPEGAPPTAYPPPPQEPQAARYA